MNQPTPRRIAAVVTTKSGEVDALIADLAQALRNDGWRVRGLVQAVHTGDAACQIALVDLDYGTQYPITQDLGSGSLACRLDSSLVAEASIVMRRLAEEGADLAIFNRFGGQEAEGGGFAAEMLALMAQGIPVLTVVPARHLAAWRTFTGDFAVELSAERTVLEQWFLAVQADATSLADEKKAASSRLR
jgi:hypothetical protein